MRHSNHLFQALFLVIIITITVYIAPTKSSETKLTGKALQKDESIAESITNSSFNRFIDKSGSYDG